MSDRASQDGAGEALVANFERLWATKNPEIVREIVAPHAVAHWSGMGTFAGSDYPERMRMTMHETIPDVRLEVTGHAIQDDLVFISWRAGGTLGGQRLEWDGIDRFHLDGALADEVHAIFDTGPFRDAFGGEAPAVTQQLS